MRLHRSLRTSLPATLLLASLAACGGGSSSSTNRAVLPYAFPATPTLSPAAISGVRPELTLPGLGDDFRFAPGSSFFRASDGRAYLVAFLERASAPDEKVELRLTLERHLAVPGLFRRLLRPESYVDNGGPIDPARWGLYDLREGQLFGLGALSGLRAGLISADGTPMQAGPGADNRCTDDGASVLLRLAVQSQPDVRPALDGAELELCFAMLPYARATAIEPSGAVEVGIVPRPAFTLPGLGGDYDFVGGGVLVERGDGNAVLRGIIGQRGAPERRFALELALRNRADGMVGPANLPSGSPRLEMPDEALRVAGGVVDASTWCYWREARGSLRGLGAMRGAEVALFAGSGAAQLGLGASCADLGTGLSAPLSLEIRSQPFAGQALAWAQPASSAQVALRSNGWSCVDSSDRDAELAISGGSALRFPGLGKEFELVAGGSFREDADGTARLSAVIMKRDDPKRRYLAELELSGRVDAGDADFPPAESPVRALLPGAYTERGGPIDTRGWHFYRECTGTLRGMGKLRGALLTVERFGASFQVGAGANGASLRWGGSGALLLRVLQQAQDGAALPSVNVARLELVLERNCTLCTTGARHDHAVSAVHTDHALWLPGLATDLKFESGAEFVEYPDGSARLNGVVRSGGSKRLIVDLRLDGRIDPRQPRHAPAGSPKLELVDAAYVENGGPVDPSGWHYYTTIEGTLVGAGDWADAELRVTRRGPAFQVGIGANGKNADPGASGWLTVELVRQPSHGPSLAPSGEGDLNLDLDHRCPE